jgi:hypothetical protein
LRPILSIFIIFPVVPFRKITFSHPPNTHQPPALLDGAVLKLSDLNICGQQEEDTLFAMVKTINRITKLEGGARRGGEAAEDGGEGTRRLIRN